MVATAQLHDVNSLNESPSRQPDKRPQFSSHLRLMSTREAAKSLKEHRFPGQRLIRPWHVAFLKYLMIHKHFRPGTSITYAVWQDKKFLVNGQHTLAALAETSGPAIWLQEETYKVHSYDEVCALYESFDRHLARRWRDIYMADAGIQGHELPAKYIMKLGGAIPLLGRGFTQHVGFGDYAALTVRDTRVRVPFITNWAPEMANFANGCHGAQSVRNMLMRAAVLSVAMVTYRFQGEHAHRFWPRLAADSGLVAGQPAHTLLRFLRDNPANKVDQALYARIVASCWNADLAGRAMERLHAHSASKPILIAGTPHDGKRVMHYLDQDLQILHTPIPVL